MHGEPFYFVFKNVFIFLCLVPLAEGRVSQTINGQIIQLKKGDIYMK